MTDERAAPTGPATPEEAAGLRHISSCRTLALIAIGVSVPSLFLAYVHPPMAAYVIAPLALVACFGALVRHMRCRCPRCRELFNMSKDRGHVWASACSHCGLPLKA